MIEEEKAEISLVGTSCYCHSHLSFWIFPSALFFGQRRVRWGGMGEGGREGVERGGEV